MGYTYRERSGFTADVGIYDLTNDRGRSLLQPEPNDREMDDLTWLAGNPIELACVSTKTTVDGKPIVKETIWALDGKNLTTKKLWTQDFPADDGVHLSVEASPSLTHAIVTVQTKSVKSYYVVTLGAAGMVISPDISEAIQEGHGFAGWTVDGTAFFGGGSKNDLSAGQPISITLSGGDGGDVVGNVSGTFSIQLTNAVTSEGSSIDLGSFFRLVQPKPNIPIGNEGLELMPSNGILRQVRFQGYWAGEDAAPVTTQLVPQHHSLSFKESSAGTKALWLTPNVKDPQKGILISPQSEQAWLHPNGRTVAFTVNGVLFVKTIHEEIR